MDTVQFIHLVYIRHLSTFAPIVTAHSERSFVCTFFKFEARLYHDIFTQQSSHAAIIRDHS